VSLQDVWRESNLAAASKTVNPRTVANLASTGGASLLEQESVFAAAERIKFVIAGGGATATTNLLVIID